VTATALRGFLAPVLGSVVMSYLGYTANFLLSFMFFATAGTMFVLHYRKRVKMGLIKV
jgi:zinc transporter ZupT